jgi:uncharacterized protein
MPRMIVALLAGMLFGVGLAVSGMVNPAKVVGFLDVAGGEWDPTLIFVMGGALLVTILAFRMILKRARPILADGFALPSKSAVDRRVLGGAALFGVGWGLSGFCPGPAVAAMVTGPGQCLPSSGRWWWDGHLYVDLRAAASGQCQDEPTTP